MRPRTRRLAVPAVALALAAAPVAAAPVAAASSDPAFHRISGQPVGVAGAVSRSAFGSAASAPVQVTFRAASVSTGSVEQVLQVASGANGAEAGAVADVSVAAGPKHVVQLSEAGAILINRATAQRLAEATLASFFGLPGSTDITDPQVAYDPVGKRWVAVAATYTVASGHGLIVRASTGTNPEKWYPGAVYADESESLSPNAVESAPRVGVSSDKVVVTAAATDVDAPTTATRLLVLPKAPLYSGGSPSAWVSDLTSTYAGQYPVVNTTKDPNLYVAVPHTGDFTVTTYSGAATSSAPKFTKSVLYPRSMTAPPVVDQGAGDLLNLGALRVTTATMRAGTLYASLSEGCQTDTHACVRLIGVSVTGMSLQLDKTFSKTGGDLMAPAVAVDTSGRPHVAYQVVASGSSTGPSLAVTVRKAPTSSKWTGSLLRRSVVAVSDGDATEETIDWSGYAGAAIDPASPWDVWVTGAWGDNPAAAGAPTWSSTVARASIALNVATVKPAKTKVPKGQKVSITGKLARPQSTGAIKGLPVALQFKPKSGGSWTTKKSGSVAADGTLKWTVKITKTGSWRLVGKGVTQSSSGGRLVTKSVGKAVTITAT